MSSIDEHIRAAQIRETVLFDYAPLGIAEVDFSGRFLRINQTLLAITGYPHEELLQKQFQDITHPDDLARDTDLIRQISIGERDNYAIEKRYIDYQGKPVWVKVTARIVRDEYQQPLYFIKMIENIQEKKLAENEILKNESMFRLAFEAAPSGLLLINEQMQIMRVNAATENMFGYSASELYGQSISILIPERYHFAHAHHVRDYQHHPEQRMMGSGRELWARRKDGTEFGIEIGLNPVTSANEKLVLIAAIDITTMKNTQEMLQAALTEKTTLLNEIHHRVKNNLQVVSSLLSLQSQNCNEIVRDALEISQGRLRAMALIHQLLYEGQDYSRIHLGSYITRLGSFLREIHSDAHNRIVLDMKGMEQAVYLDIQQAVPCGLLITELLTNAFKHAFPDKQCGHIDVILAEQDGGTCLIVSDDGIGLPKPFLEGTSQSLGFQLIPLLAEQAHAHWRCESDEHGTRFEITLPGNREDQL